MPASVAVLTPAHRHAGAVRRARLACALLVLAGLSACTTGFVYNRLDWVVAWYVDGLVSLDDKQEDRLHDIVRRTLVWHRQSQLPRYIALFDEMAVEADRPVSAERLEARYQQVAGFLDDFLRHVLPDAAGLLATLTDEQISELMKNVEEDNEDIWDEFAGDTPEVRQKRRVKNAVRSLQRFVGRLSADQSVLVESRLGRLHDVSDQWMERRRHWQGRFFDVLRSVPGGPPLEAALLDLAMNPDQFDTGDYRRRVDGNRRLIMSMIAELSEGLTPRQRKHLRQKFEEYADDLRKMAAEGQGSG